MLNNLNAFPTFHAWKFEGGAHALTWKRGTSSMHDA